MLKQQVQQLSISERNSRNIIKAVDERLNAVDTETIERYTSDDSSDQIDIGEIPNQVWDEILADDYDPEKQVISMSTIRNIVFDLL